MSAHGEVVGGGTGLAVGRPRRDLDGVAAAWCLEAGEEPDVAAAANRVSPRTVEQHLAKVLRKLNAASRADLVNSD
jgi:hypothetical protein